MIDHRAAVIGESGVVIGHDFVVGGVADPPFDALTVSGWLAHDKSVWTDDDGMREIAVRATAAGNSASMEPT